MDLNHSAKAPLTPSALHSRSSCRRGRAAELRPPNRIRGALSKASLPVTYPAILQRFGFVLCPSVLSCVVWPAQGRCDDPDRTGSVDEFRGRMRGRRCRCHLQPSRVEQALRDVNTATANIGRLGPVEASATAVFPRRPELSDHRRHRRADRTRPPHPHHQGRPATRNGRHARRPDRRQAQQPGIGNRGQPSRHQVAFEIADAAVDAAATSTAALTPRVTRMSMSYCNRYAGPE
jgi:hypothetical protein